MPLYDTSAFFDLLGHKGYVRVRLILDPKFYETTTGARILVRTGAWSEIAPFVKTSNENGYHAYFVVHHLTSPSAGNDAESFAGADTLAFDFDNTEWRTLAAAITPHAVVETSEGKAHIYYRISEMLAPRVYEAVARILAARWGADMAATDIARILRIPDTINHKTGYRANLSALRPDLDPYDLDDFIPGWSRIAAEIEKFAKQTHDNPRAHRREFLKSAMAAVLNHTQEQERTPEFGRAVIDYFRARARKTNAEGVIDDNYNLENLIDLWNSLCRKHEENEAGRRNMSFARLEAMAKRNDPIYKVIAAEGLSPEETLDLMRERLALLVLSSEVYVTDIPSGQVWSMATAKSLFSEYYITPGEKKKPVPVFELWTKGEKKKRNGLIYYPSHALPPGLADSVNLWRGWGVAPKEGKLEYIPRLINEVLCRGDERKITWLWNFLAHMVQKPEDKAEKALVLKGAKGAGKSAFCYLIGRMLGDGRNGEHANVIETSIRDLMEESFTDPWATRLLIVINEAAHKGQKDIFNFFKNLITSPTVKWNAKFRPSLMIPSFHRLIFTTNEDWAAPVESGDRRYVVFEVGEALEPEFYDGLWNEIKGDGPAIVLDMLMKRDIRTFNPRAPFSTKELVEQVALNFTGVDRWLFEQLIEGWDVLAERLILSAGEYCSNDEGVRVRRTTLHDLYCKATGLRVGQKAFSRTIAKIYGAGDKMHGGIRLFVFPPLPQARRMFEEAMKTSFDWEE